MSAVAAIPTSPSKYIPSLGGKEVIRQDVLIILVGAQRFLGAYSDARSLTLSFNTLLGGGCDHIHGS